jgi:hypothetical protein
MNITQIIQGFLIFVLAHIIVWFQVNGQFKWDWFKENEWVLALAGIPVSFLYIWATKYSVNGFDGLLWPTRFIGFGAGIIVYVFFVSYFFNEGINLKTFVSLLLATALICVQVLWKN